MTTQELLDALNTAILARMNGQAVDEWSEGDHRVAHMPLNQMLACRSRLETQLEQETNGCAMPVISVEI